VNRPDNASVVPRLSLRLVSEPLARDRVAIWTPGLGDALSGGLAELDRLAAERALVCAEEGSAIAREAGFKAEPLVCEAHAALWAALIHAADEHEASVQVVGRRGRSPVASALLGSVSTGVVNHALRPVLVVPAAG
jgi:nucleotide-binding universal stress UspA family protein